MRPISRSTITPGLYGGCNSEEDLGMEFYSDYWKLLGELANFMYPDTSLKATRSKYESVPSLVGRCL